MTSPPNSIPSPEESSAEQCGLLPVELSADLSAQQPARSSAELSAQLPVELPAQFAHLRRFALDGALLLFDRDTGLNVLCEGEETAHLKQTAPRMVQFAITNSCNLACTFCSRDIKSNSDWTIDEAFTLLAELSHYGLLEVAFGGGEPWIFPGFAELVCRLYDETPLAVNFTTNGLALTTEDLVAIKGKYGQLRLSLYDDNDWRNMVAMLAREKARFGVNYLVTPERLKTLETTILELCELGCRDILLLSYNGYDQDMHLSKEATSTLSGTIKLMAAALKGRCQIKLGVCWGEQMQSVPRLFNKADCGAGREFLVITSDKKIQPCSFHQVALPVQTAADVMNIYNKRRSELESAALMPGCSRENHADHWARAKREEEEEEEESVAAREDGKEAIAIQRPGGQA